MAYAISSARKDLGGFSVSRIIPNQNQCRVGPFVFVDHMGPAEFPAGRGINVRPHPHIGLATISYLMEGNMLHRDSLGTIQEISPGDVNWMTAGKGIVHSERETIETRGKDHVLNGLQCWIALPEDKSDMEPSFLHVNRAQLPYIHREKVLMRLIAGEAYNYTSPVKTYSSMFYLDAITEAGAVVERPCGLSETACYVISGEVKIDSENFKAGQFVILEDEETIETVSNSRYFLLGGKKLEKEPILRWNFVAYSMDKIREAEERWRTGQFPRIPGDDVEFIPLPE
ncbi:pirin family protein [Pseudomaricurvus alkylphenolicus]|jgi:redox-sensitive bicupin YhaK (pirin superfamily)|uniref:pirin family protein n=1 Tax=Pseudomaricurvus alkylphenolicus TaxID=1306991 RepID=UPI001423BAE5|nr:pirin family protein [Pseudomaricurvus alkylphenolicus]NIB40381.1 pirin family protein [Pseudomaricurvus alkylphenolicus]